MSAIDAQTSSCAAVLEWLTQHGLDACELDDRTPVHEALAQIPPSVRKREPACLAVHAALERLEGHVDSALALYERALRLNGDTFLDVRIRENLAHLYSIRRQDSDAERVIAGALKLSPYDPKILSIRTVLRARRRDPRVADELEFLESQTLSLSDLERARVYRHLSSIAYEGLRDAPRAERYATLVIEYAESARAHCHAIVAYWALASLSQNHIGDNERAFRFGELMSEAATKAGDIGLLITSLIVQCSRATDAGDRDRFIALRERLRDTQGAERYNERVSIVHSEAMNYGWDGKFATMHQYLTSVNTGRIISANSAILEALMAVSLAGSGDEAGALRSAYRGLSLGRPLAKEPWLETRQRLLARLLSGCVLLCCGRRTEAIRALRAYESAMTSALVCLRDAIVDSRYDAVRERAQDVYGYAMLCKALEGATVSASRGAEIGLTEREIDVLRAAAGGRSARAISEELAIGPRTVEWHRNNALKKLGVKSTIAAVTKARELQIIPYAESSATASLRSRH